MLWSLSSPKPWKFWFWKQLPDLDIVNSRQQEEGTVNEDERSPYINIESVMPEDRDSILPIAICRCLSGKMEHYACYKCLHGFCHPGAVENESQKDECVRCPRCKTVVYESHPEWD